MVRLQLLVGVALLCGAIAASCQPPPKTPTEPPTTSATPVTVSIATDKKTYTAKDPIKLTLTARNPLRTPVKLTFNSGMKYDFEIRKGKAPSTVRVWQWSHGRMFFQMITYVTVEPGKKLVYSETFTPGDKGPDGKPLPSLEPGTYTATAILALSGRAPRPMASATFTVK